MRRLQRTLGWLSLFVLGPALMLYLRMVRGYRLGGTKALRQCYRAAVASGRPVLICANHLTMIDSLILHRALATIPDYLLHYRRLSWNAAARENFHQSRILRALVYLGKTLPVDRAGSAEHHAALLGTLERLLRQGETVTIFPEGTRSRTGRIEPGEVRYGVGRLLQVVPGAVVICVYLRARTQRAYAFAPPRGDDIDLRFSLLEPGVVRPGLRGARELARRVIDTLKDLEEQYFLVSDQRPMYDNCHGRGTRMA